MGVEKSSGSPYTPVAASGSQKYSSVSQSEVILQYVRDPGAPAVRRPKGVKEAGTRIFKLYRSSNHWAKLGRENCPHRFFVCFRGANNKFQAVMSKSGDNSTLKIVNCAYVRSCSANLTPL